MPEQRSAMLLTPEEDAQLTAAALSDPDAQPLTEEQLAKMMPWSEYVKTYGVGIGADVAFDRDLVAAFESTGEGWRKRMNDALREWAVQHGMLPPA